MTSNTFTTGGQCVGSGSCKTVVLCNMPTGGTCTAPQTCKGAPPLGPHVGHCGP
jgi:hypothetical protein